MSKFKKIILTIIITLLGIVLEVVNYYVFILDDKLFKIGLTTAGFYIIFISIIGNILFHVHLENKELENE